MEQKRLELVVAHYRENLKWLRNIPAASVAVTVYDKDPGAIFPGGTLLPNVGREAHTYLHHIATRYESLTEWTIFCQGKPFDHAFDFHQSLRNFSADPDAIGSFHWLGHLIDTDDAQGERLFKSWSKNEDGRGLEMVSFYERLFGTAAPQEYPFVLGAQFVVHRNLIRKNSCEFYRHALEISASFPDGAHCFERIWPRVFGHSGIDPAVLGTRRTVLLKPMKYQSETSQIADGKDAV